MHGAETKHVNGQQPEGLKLMPGCWEPEELNSY